MMAVACGPAAALAQAPTTVRLEDLTWTELRTLIRAGKTTVIVPVGGVEQSGPDMALGKHDARVRYLAERIARSLGNAIVAPVVSYVPEGTIEPPTGHMAFPGTITIPPEVFRQTLESAAMSFKLHGFRDVVFLGDHGGYQMDLKAVADDLNHHWVKSPARAHFIPQYYRATQTTYVAALRARGYSLAQIGTHAGLADTALTLAIDPQMVRAQRIRTGGRLSLADGVHGDPTGATAALGQIGVIAIIRETTKAIQIAVARP
jgi:creatinine amidohydrolase/Fe(II)-dependent formamide hydrolase-like protein